jgi:hypothetical protein
MSGWLDTLFGNLPPSPPARPPSRGATFGANYQALPTSSHIDDRRQDPPDYPYWLRRVPPWAPSDYSPSPLGGAIPSPRSPFTFNPGAANQMFAPPPSRIPYMGPMWPGDPGWTPPPSPSGPHNPGGDPNRPGYSIPGMGLPNNAASQTSAQPSYQQLVDFLQSWPGGTQ